MVDMTVQPEYAPLVRLRCPACNKTVADDPDFALPHKHYTRQSIFQLRGFHGGASVMVFAMPSA
jgi:hypothetical protein